MLCGRVGIPFLRCTKVKPAGASFDFLLISYAWGAAWARVVYYNLFAISRVSGDRDTDHL